MKSAIFSALVWASSTALLGWRNASLSGSVHMLKTLRGWAVVAFLLALVLQWLRRHEGGLEESRSRQVRSAVSAFAIFAVLVMLVLAARNSTASTWAWNVLSLIGGCLAPVVLLMGLEFPDLRPRAMAATWIMAAGLVSFAGFSAVLVRPASNPGPIRIHQPADSTKEPRRETTYFL